MNCVKKKSKELRKLFGIHTAIIKTLEDRLIHSLTEYNIIKKEEKYHDKTEKCFGECDLYATGTFGKSKYLLCFEVKTLDTEKNRSKAIKQLNRDINYYSKIFEPSKICAFYVYGIGKRYTIEKIPYKDSK